MAKADLGTKRIDPETGRKFYDLNKDPIVSPYTGIAYPRSAFEAAPAKARPGAAKSAVVEDDEDIEIEKDVETVTLEEADEEAVETGAVKADDDLDGDDDVVDDTFLADEEDDEDGAVDDIVGDVDEEES